jgi:hypothetical protein
LADKLWRHWSETEVFEAPARSTWPIALRRARLVGLALLAVQLGLLCWWSWMLASRFALTRDFALYEQAAWLIVHGHLDPISSTIPGHGAFWLDHADFMFWPVAAVWGVWPHPYTLLWVQDLATVGAEAIAFGWICDIASVRATRTGATRAAVALVVVGVVLLACNPWIAWASSFDFHSEAMGALFAMAAARDLFRGRRRAWLWMVLCCLDGNVAASYIATIGLSAMLAGRAWWRQGALSAAFGAGWTLTVMAAGATAGSPIGELYAPIVKGTAAARPNAGFGAVVSVILTHPGRPLATLWANRLNIWAVVSASGVVGWLWLPALVPTAVVLISSNLGISVFSFPGFQTLLAAVLCPVGLVTLGSRLIGRRGRLGRLLLPALLVAVLVNTLTWSALWLPHIGAEWLDVSPGAASTLRRVQAQIRPGDEVIASQGIIGALADHANLGLMFEANASYQVNARRVWVILAPAQGTETTGVAGVYGDIAQLASDPAFRVVADSHGIWAFVWRPPPGTTQIVFRPDRFVTRAWDVAGPAGTAVLAGPPATWYTESNGRRGYVVDHAYWREEPGVYRANVSLAVSSTANVEVWDSTTSTLLDRLTVPGTNGVTTVQLSADLRSVQAAQEYPGWGIWRTKPQEPRGDDLEIRVWSPGGDENVTVYTVGLRGLR